MSTTPSTLPDPKNRSKDLLTLAIWFGLTTGLVEGLIFVILMKSGRMMSAWIEISWIVPIVNLILFFVFGVTFILVDRLFPRLPSWLGLAFFSFLMFFNWLVLILSEHVKIYALIVLAAGLAATLIRRASRSEAAFSRFFHKSLPWLFVLALLVLIGVEGGKFIVEQTAMRRVKKSQLVSPNILFIVIDTLRADHLSLYGYDRPTSPSLDQIGAEGTVFSSAFAPSSYTLPSHVSLMTGQYIYQHGVEWDNFRGLFAHPDPTIAEVLQEHGYRTAAFSANLFWFTREQGFGRGFIHFEDYFHSPTDMFLRSNYGRGLEKYFIKRIGFEDIPARKLASDINRSALRWVKQNQEIPFFVFLNYLDTHDPYTPPQPYRSRFSFHDEPGGVLNARVGRDDPNLSPDQLQDEIDAYDGAIAYVDDQIKDLLQELQKLGELEGTIIIITSDHGEAFGEHTTYLHGGSLYLEEIHVPLILWGADIPPGVRIDQPVSITSLPATILKLIGANQQPAFSYPPLSDLWDGVAEPGEWPDPLAELGQQDWKPERSPVSQGWSRALINSMWHLIEYENRETELFKWVEDPQESNNLATSIELKDFILQLYEVWSVLGVEK